VKELSGIVFCFVFVLAVGAHAEELNYVDLIERLTDMERLSLLPAPGEQCAQWSSYDRGSQYDAKLDRYVGWDANGDGHHVIRTEGDQVVLAEIEGPGCIWRLWSATPKKGHVRIHLDGAETPAVDLPFVQYFDGTTEPFDYPGIVHVVSKGHNNYLPIPYAKSCKITADPDWGAYFQFVYTTYPAGTHVPTFTTDLSDEEKDALARASEKLTEGLGTDPACPRQRERTKTRKVRLPAGETVKVLELRGPRALTALKVSRPEFEDREEEIQALRELALRVTWDREEAPAVWSPLGDFFGTAPGINEYKSLPLGMTDKEFYSYWYMPFGKRALIEITNDGATDREVELSITYAPLTKPIEQYGRFHAKWHRDAFNPGEAERWPDWMMLKTEGRGRFCGVSLHVWNPKGSAFNPYGGEGGWCWWGEGDEKFFVDGEKFPSTFGTGSEDYFGYAWCFADAFQNAYHNQPINEANCGHISNNRWQITDNVPFQAGFEGCIEKYYANHAPTLYAAVAYWYLKPGGVDPYSAVHVWDRVGYWHRPRPTFFAKDAIEAEEMKILEKTGGLFAFRD